MSTDLETRLREQQTAVGLDRPVDDIFHAATGCACATRLPITKNSVPVAAESRPGTVLACYRRGAHQVSCALDGQPGGRLTFDRGHAEDYTPLPEGTDLGFVSFGSFDPGVQAGAVTDVWTVSQVSDRVDRVTADLGGATYDGTIIDGLVPFWETGSFDRHQVDDAVFTAYDAEGHVLERVDAGA